MTKVRAQVNEETNKGQLPWGHTNLIGSVYLNPAPAAAGGPVEAANTPAVTAGPASEVELEFWRSIKDSNKPEELNAYLTNYPNGTFKSLALARIASLQDGPSTTTRNLSTSVDPSTFTDEADQTAEDQIGLDRGQRRDVQRRLTGLGFDTKINGKFDEETRGVIMRWQAARGYPKTGFLNKLQHQGAAIGDRIDPRGLRRFGRRAGAPFPSFRRRRRPSLPRRRWRTRRIVRPHDGRVVPQVGFGSD